MQAEVLVLAPITTAHLIALSILALWISARAASVGMIWSSSSITWTSLAARIVDTDTQMLVVMLRRYQHFPGPELHLEVPARQGRKLEHLGHRHE